MNADVRNILYGLTIERNFGLVAEISEKAVLSDPHDLPARYCAAMARICSGELEIGFGRLKMMVEVYSQNVSSFSDERDSKRLVGYAALQLAQLAEFGSRHRENKNYDTQYSAYGAVTAKKIAQEIDDAHLSALAGEILTRHLPWRIINKDNRILSGTYLVPESPYTLQIEPTNHCNLNCRMCCRSRMTRQKGYMAVSLFERMLKQWKYSLRELSLTHLVFPKLVFNHSRPGLIKLYFMGEPLLHPQLESMIACAREARIEVGIQTNGLLLSDNSIRSKLLDAAPSGIYLSIDGVNRETYETVRRGSSWNDICSSVAALRKERDARGLAERVQLGISTILPDTSRESFKAVMDFLAPLTELVDTCSGINLNRHFGGEFITAQGGIHRYESGDSPSCWNTAQEPFCHEPFEKLNILWDGTIAPCCVDINGEMCLGRVNQGVDSVWRGENMRKLHLALLSNILEDYPLCYGCQGKVAGYAYAAAK